MTFVNGTGMVLEGVYLLIYYVHVIEKVGSESVHYMLILHKNRKKEEN